jgi:hypothetical protein
MLVKALPQPSKTYGETVCCAGITKEKTWKRLYPVRYRHLSGASSFGRWDWVDFQYGRPKSDSRPESCAIQEDTISIIGKMPAVERARFLQSTFLGSGQEAARKGLSLALIRPKNTKFTYKRKRPEDLLDEREAYKFAARQTSLLDEELEQLEPPPFHFRFSFEDEAGQHNYQNGDWEAHAMFFREKQRTSEKHALEWMDRVFNEEFPSKGMAFAIGNLAKRPQTWQLLGVIRLDFELQAELPL